MRKERGSTKRIEANEQSNSDRQLSGTRFLCNWLNKSSKVCMCSRQRSTKFGNEDKLAVIIPCKLSKFILTNQ
ncbi:hypothetical protein QQP08_008442 [Theobroma cacao]|nr:hypothetical protein QQP08_008442 [Theobroma cacao]